MKRYLVAASACSVAFGLTACGSEPRSSTAVDHQTAPTDSGSFPSTTPPPCSGEWAALIDVEVATKHATIEEAVAARDRKGILAVTGVEKDRASGMTYATVVDDW